LAHNEEAHLYCPTASSVANAAIMLKATRKTGTTWLECLVAETLQSYCDHSNQEGQSCEIVGDTRSHQTGMSLTLAASELHPQGWNVQFMGVEGKHVRNMESCVKSQRPSSNMVFLNIYRDPRDTLVSHFYWKHPHINQTVDALVPHSFVRDMGPKIVENIAYFHHFCQERLPLGVSQAKTKSILVFLFLFIHAAASFSFS
jgi:hypothetical protein